MKKEGIYFPHILSVGLARKVARQTRNPEYKGQLVPRSTYDVWKLFALRRSAVRIHDHMPVAHAGITHTFAMPEKRVEEVGAVLSWGEKRNGYAQEVVRALIARRRRPKRQFIAMVESTNNGSLKLFEQKLSGRRMDRSEVPEEAYKETIPGSLGEEIVFDITNI